MEKKLRIAVIFGGRSGEHEVSLVSATSIIGTLPRQKYIVIPVGITPSGAWMSGQEALSSFKKGLQKNLLPVTLSFHPDRRGIFIGKKFQPVDVAFPVLHGPYGEDGTIQGLFEMAGIPYVGCGVAASAAAMNKLMSKMIFAAHGLPQVKFLSFTRSFITKEFGNIQKLIRENLGLPCFVKPANLGSSVGISKVKTWKELLPALKLASEFDDSVIVEQGVDAREIEVAVLGNENPTASVAGEIVPNREFYDFYAKYVDNASKLFIPAKISPQKIKIVQGLALRAYKALECRGMARVDFLMDKKTGRLFLNEINTIPGFTSISMYPKLFAASGIPYERLIDHLVQFAIEAFQIRQSKKMTFDSGSDWYK